MNTIGDVKAKKLKDGRCKVTLRMNSSQAQTLYDALNVGSSAMAAVAREHSFSELRSRLKTHGGAIYKNFTKEMK